MVHFPVHSRDHLLLFFGLLRSPFPSCLSYFASQHRCLQFYTLFFNSHLFSFPPPPLPLAYLAFAHIRSAVFTTASLNPFHSVSAVLTFAALRCCSSTSRRNRSATAPLSFPLRTLVSTNHSSFLPNLSSLSVATSGLYCVLE